MKLEAGKYYRAEDGSKIGPMLRFGEELKSARHDEFITALGDGDVWHECGRYKLDAGDRRINLIAEWTDTDLTAITTPFGLLDKATQDALKGSGCLRIEMYTGAGWSLTHFPDWSPRLTYRARKEPVEDTVKHKGCVFQTGSHQPIVSANQHDDDWVQGVTTTHRVDGKPVRIVWEASQ